ncbi:methyl-accepting chemotaxis protein (plasmid) [Agrobacterium deltaense]|uniref:methyl-accepting chemotaxis protein n=1 Tax=Agrobacterium deltaense TaxID=1183412 RepID=UPI003D95D7D0
MKIRTKILGIVLGVSLVSAGLALFSSQKIEEIGSSYSLLVNQRDPGVLKIVGVAKSVSDAAYASHRIFADPTDLGERISSKALRTRSINRANFLLDGALKRFPEQKERIDGLRKAVQSVGDASENAVRLAEIGSPDNGRASLVQLDEAYFAFSQTYAKLYDQIASSASYQAESLDRTTSSVINLTIAGSFAGIAFGIVVSLLVSSKGITGPLRKLAGAMNALASGDLDVAVYGGRRRDEIGDMARAVEVFKDAANENHRLANEAEVANNERLEMHERQAAEDESRTQRLRDLIDNVRTAFDGLATGALTTRIGGAFPQEFEPIRIAFNSSVEKLESAIAAVDVGISSMQADLNAITDSASDLSRRTEQQAAALEETSAALSEVKKKVEETSFKSVEATKLAEGAHDEAKRGVSVLAEAIGAMSEIERSSSKINNIVGLIDQIAFQTNLLALNAGVEAARAGDSGKGFAVVAHEVRALAQQSAVAAQEIKSLISNANGQVKEGAELVTKSGAVLERILTQVDGVSGAIAEIAISAQDQAASLHQVSAAAVQMDKVTQQNAGMVEETTAATQNLLLETTQLAEMMREFKTAAGAPADERLSRRAA